MVRQIYQVKTQKLREKVLSQLQEIFDMACGQAKNKNLGIMEREKYARVAAYTAQVMEGVAKGFDDCHFNEDMAKLDGLIHEAERIRKTAGQATAQTGENTASQGPS
jgi:hypothetical protein